MMSPRAGATLERTVPRAAAAETSPATSRLAQPRQHGFLLEVVENNTLLCSELDVAMHRRGPPQPRRGKCMRDGRKPKESSLLCPPRPTTSEYSIAMDWATSARRPRGRVSEPAQQSPLRPSGASATSASSRPPCTTRVTTALSVTGSSSPSTPTSHRADPNDGDSFCRSAQTVCAGEAPGTGGSVRRTGVRLGVVLAAASLMPGCVVAASGASDGNGGAFIVLLLPLLLGIAFIAVSRIGRRRQRSHEFKASRPSTAMLRAELSVLADDILRFEPRLAVNEDARHDFESATHRYRIAQAAFDEAPDEVDLVRVQRVVDEATWSMSRVRAIVEGRRPPDPPATLQRPGRHGEPAIGLDDDDHPTYVGSNAPVPVGLVRRRRRTLRWLARRHDARRLRWLGRRGRNCRRRPDRWFRRRSDGLVNNHRRAPQEHQSRRGVGSADVRETGGEPDRVLAVVCVASYCSQNAQAPDGRRVCRAPEAGQASGQIVQGCSVRGSQPARIDKTVCSSISRHTSGPGRTVGPMNGTIAVAGCIGHLQCNEAVLHRVSGQFG